MTQVSYIIASIFLFFFFTTGIFKDQSVPNKKETNNLNITNENLVFNRSDSTDIGKSINYQQVEINNLDCKSEILPELFVETPLQMEPWMKEPKSWNINE